MYENVSEAINQLNIAMKMEGGPCMSELLSFMKKNLKYHSYCIYDVEYSEDARNENENHQNLLTSEQKSNLSKHDLRTQFQSIPNLLNWYFYDLASLMKLDAIRVIGEAIRGAYSRNILSLGAGPCVLEFLLKSFYQEKVNIVSTDYDKYMVSRVKELMPEITSMTFDFYNDDIGEIARKHDIDTIIMLGSACSMDKETYIRFLRDCKEAEIKTIYTFEAGILPEWKYDLYPAYLLFRLPISYWFNKKDYEMRKKRLETASFHAFKRTRFRLIQIYRMLTSHSLNTQKQ